MSEPHTKRQHFVPQFLLKNFSMDGKRVIVWDRKQRVFFETGVKDICYLDDLYEVKWKDSNPKLGTYVLDNKLEEEFSQTEGRASSVIKHIIERANGTETRIIFNKEEKSIIYDFVTVLYLRNPAKMAEIQDYYDGVENEPGFDTMRRGTEYIFEQWGWGSPKSIFEYSIKSTIFSKEVDGSPYKVEFERISALRYVFWRSKNEKFVTASFPMHIVSFDKENFDRIVIPISSSLSLVLFRGDFPGLEEGIILDPDDNVIEFNMKWFMKTYSIANARFFIAKDEKSIKQLL